MLGLLGAMRSAPLVLIAFAVVLSTGTASANGRFPEAQAIESVPSDPSTLFLRTTFGVLVSRDAGRSWSWICERALGYEGQWDPPIAVTRDGRLWVGLESGLTSTRDGCDLEPARELDGYTVKDLTTDPAGETLWAITGAPGKKSWVWRRAPGKRFERLAGLEDVNVMTIEVAAKSPSRVYVSGQPYATIRGRIYRSDDGGSTLSPATDGPERVDGGGTAAALAADGPFLLGAVDPVDPNRLLVRHLHAAGSDLLLSRDGGRTFTNVLSIDSAMYGFAKSRDGRTYVAGSGLPEHGIFRSSDRGERFEPIAKHGVLCLHATGTSGAEALFVCQNALTQGAPAIGVSRDEGRTVESLARFADIRGPVACASPDARASLCAGTWADTQALFQPPDGGLEAAARDGGARPRRRRDAGAAPASGASSDPAPPRRSCACDAVGDAGGTDPGWTIAGLAALALGVRARLSRGSKLTQRR